MSTEQSKYMNQFDLNFITSHLNWFESFIHRQPFAGSSSLKWKKKISPNSTHYSVCELFQSRKLFSTKWTNKKRIDSFDRFRKRPAKNSSKNHCSCCIISIQIFLSSFFHYIQTWIYVICVFFFSFGVCVNRNINIFIVYNVQVHKLFGRLPVHSTRSAHECSFFFSLKCLYISHL